MKLRRVSIVACLLFMSGLLKAQDLLVMESKNLPLPDSVWVFKPSSYDRAKEYPLVYLLHGFSGNYKSWNKIIDCQQYANDYGFIIVCPDGLLDSWYLNSPVQKNKQYVSFFFDELYPSIKKRYAVKAQDIFISGLSMGGHGALSLFLARPELFKSAGSTSGVVDLSVGNSKNYKITALLGADLQQADSLWHRYSVLKKIENNAALKKPIIFDCGTEDKFHSANDALYEKCLELKIPATYTSQSGGHTATYWKNNVKTHFDFFSKQIMTKN
ncbi:esterase [Pedobacter frigiditerrae]|uniref:Esterase n=1 Tax=Pedobacter frigiditerrae TaxID=2530452 RepID=A0A4R0MPY6_9SPHI|nr:alpha/beta hydrolase family protein [Pedobacter frigiditerrae]TCC88607.1 esterase [Pedobacter frigiditerrae]